MSPVSISGILPQICQHAVTMPWQDDLPIHTKFQPPATVSTDILLVPGRLPSFPRENRSIIGFVAVPKIPQDPTCAVSAADI